MFDVNRTEMGSALSFPGHVWLLTPYVKCLFFYLQEMTTFSVIHGIRLKVNDNLYQIWVFIIIKTNEITSYLLTLHKTHNDATGAWCES